MSTAENASDLHVEYDLAIERATNGIRDPEAMRVAGEEVDRVREQVFQRVGYVNFAVPTIRALREGEDHAG
jgi:hypothetical protein